MPVAPVEYKTTQIIAEKHLNYLHVTRNKAFPISNVITVSLKNKWFTTSEIPTLVYTSAPDELYIDTSDIKPGTTIILREKTFQFSTDSDRTQELNISFAYDDEKFELVIVGNALQLPDIHFTATPPESSKPSNVIHPKQFIRPSKVTMRGIKQLSGNSSTEGSAMFDDMAFSGDNSGDNMTEVSDDDTVLIGTTSLLLGSAAAGQAFWIIGSLKPIDTDVELPDAVEVIFDSIGIVLRLSSYIVGLGLPVIQDLLIHGIYRLVNKETLGWRWIPHCCSF